MGFASALGFLIMAAVAQPVETFGAQVQILPAAIINQNELAYTWSGGRAAEGSGLENRRRVSARGFESHPFLQMR